jgi:hypothetical protein
MNEWVVTYRYHVDLCCGIMEFFRGTESECRRIKRQFAGGSSDVSPTHCWDVLVGPAKDWDVLLIEDTSQ